MIPVRRFLFRARFLVLSTPVFLLLLSACQNPADKTDDPPPPDTSDVHLTLTWDQHAFACMIMGEGETEHIMCNHGHSLNYRSENLYERYLYLKAMGVDSITEAHLHMTDAMMPDPLTPVLRAAVGERVRLRVISYGPAFHTFHVHGHLWVDAGDTVDVRTLGPADVYDKAEFNAGAGIAAGDSLERGGPGDWLYHCHVETHMPSGMWGIFRVADKGAPGDTGSGNRYSNEVPSSLGAGPGDTIDVYVVSVELPLVVRRVYDSLTMTLKAVERPARFYYPLPDKAEFDSVTSLSIRARIGLAKDKVGPWILSLKLGTTARVHHKNLIPYVPVSLHPHGVSYSSENDGTMPEDAAWAGGPAIDYLWTADAAGTWPLHDHQKALENIGRGLFAAIVVKSDAETATLDRDYLVFMHDFDHDWFMGNAVPSGGGH